MSLILVRVRVGDMNIGPKKVSRACFVIFLGVGAQNIAGESSLKIPYGTKAVKECLQTIPLII